MDLFQASGHMTHPDFDLCKSYLECECITLPALRHQEQQLSTAFAFPVWAIEDKFQEVIWDIRSYLRVIWSQQTEFAVVDPSRRPVARYRNTIQYRLLSIRKSPSQFAREACRLAVLIFAYGVIYPLKNMRPLLRFADSLRLLLEGSGKLDNDFRLWSLMMGAMATYGTDVMNWYVREIKELAGEMSLKTWPELKGTLEKFLWFAPSCNEGALEIWVLCLPGDDARREGAS